MNTENEKTPNLKIYKPAELAGVPGPESYFTGSATIKMITVGSAPSCLACAAVGFSEGARSAWHSHPKGQLLIVIEGSGLIQEWGKPVQRIQKGDVIWTEPGVKHWHGAAPSSSMTHIATQESLDGKNVEWMEKVTDEEYRAQPQNL